MGACNGQTTETAKCNTQYCESWVNWQPWSSCANPNGATCGNGDRIRVRECTGQPGAPGCRGSGLESAKCIISTVNGLTGYQALHAARRAEKEWQHSPGLARSLASVLVPIEKRINVPKRFVRDSKTGESGQNALPLVVPGQLDELENVMVLLISTTAGLWINENPARNRHALTSTDSSRILMVASMECQATVIKMYFKNFSEIIISSRIMDKLLILVILVSVRIMPLVPIPVM